MQAVQWWQKAPPRQCELPTLPTSPNTPAPVGWEPYLRTLKSALTSPPPRPRQRPCAALGAPSQEDREVGHAQYLLVQDHLAPRDAEPLLGLPQDVVALGAQQEQMRLLRSAAGAEEHTSEIQSLMRHASAAFCLKQKK